MDIREEKKKKKQFARISVEYVEFWKVLPIKKYADEDKNFIKKVF